MENIQGDKVQQMLHQLCPCCSHTGQLTAASTCGVLPAPFPYLRGPAVPGVNKLQVRVWPSWNSTFFTATVDHSEACVTLSTRELQGAEPWWLSVGTCSILHSSCLSLPTHHFISPSLYGCLHQATMHIQILIPGFPLSSGNMLFSRKCDTASQMVEEGDRRATYSVAMVGIFTQK